MKELKRLNRAELLELLLTQTRETERLQKELEETKARLNDRNLRIQETGDLAQAVLSLNGVMEAAQAAANQYLENIQAMERETKEKCQLLLRQAREEAEKIKSNQVMV